jgi:hypothetical protein
VGQNHTLHTVHSQYQYCGSGMFIPDPDFCFVHPGSRIQKQQQKRGVKKNVCPTFICSHKNHKIENYINVELVKKKIWANYQRIIELSTQKIVINLSRIWVWDPGSGKNLFRIPDPGVKTTDHLSVCLSVGNFNLFKRRKKIGLIFRGCKKTAVG